VAAAVGALIAGAWFADFVATFRGEFWHDLGQVALTLLSALAGAVIGLAVVVLFVPILVGVALAAAFAWNWFLGLFDDPPPSDPGTIIINYISTLAHTGTLPTSQTVETPGSVVLRQQGNLQRTGFDFWGWRYPDGRILSAGGYYRYNYVVSGTRNLNATWFRPLIAQETEVWCWAAAIQMATGTTTTQADMAWLVHGDKIQVASLHEMYVVFFTETLPDTRFTLQHSPRTQAQLRASINAGNPVVAVVYWLDAIGGHAIVISGWRFYQGAYQFLVHDPWAPDIGSSDWFSYSQITTWICPTYGTTGAWTDTFWR